MMIRTRFLGLLTPLIISMFVVFKEYSFYMEFKEEQDKLEVTI